MLDHLIERGNNAGRAVGRLYGRSFFLVLAEFRRALAAARRYENLRYGRACRDGHAPTDIPRRIFEEFYARRSNTDPAPRDVSGRDPIDIDLRLRAWRAARIKALMSSALSTIFAALREALRRAGGRFTVSR